MSRYGVSDSTSSARQLAGAVRDDVVPRRRDDVRHGRLGDALSRISSIGMGLPRRVEWRAVITTFASLERRRCATAGAAKPEKIGTWIAPTCAQACEAIAASADIGRKSATRSPGSTPSRTSASASRVTSRESSAKVSVRARCRPRARPTAASASGVRSAQRCTQLRAIEILPPGNHVVHSGPRESSKTRVPRLRELEPDVLDRERPEPVGVLGRARARAAAQSAAAGAPDEPRRVRVLDDLRRRAPDDSLTSGAPRTAP